MKLTNDEAMTVFNLSYQRSMIIPQIIFYCQTIKLLADNYYISNQTLAASIESEARTSVASISRR